jgi:uncharacterized membrane protein HdeD (DUF308 family)
MSNEDSTVDPVRVARRVTACSIALGVLLILAGSLGHVYVVAATITSAILFAWLLLMAGTAALVDAWQRHAATAASRAPSPQSSTSVPAWSCSGNLPSRSSR